MKGWVGNYSDFYFRETADYLLMLSYPMFDRLKITD
jgi:hypothetical protein